MAELFDYRMEAVHHLERIARRWGSTPAPQGDRKISSLLRELDGLPPVPDGVEGQAAYEGIYPWVGKLSASPETVPGLFPAGFVVPEHQLRAPNYPSVSSPLLGKLTFTGGFMEPHGHSWKRVTEAIYSDGRIVELAASDRNLGIDYHVDGLQIRAWLPGVVTAVGREGGYGRRCRIRCDQAYAFQGKDYPIWMAFAHAQSFRAKTGDRVAAGQVIGVQGGSGANGDNDYPSHVDLRVWIEVGSRVIDLSPNLLINRAEFKKTRAEVFTTALEFSLKWEGGLADHVNDYGGRTNYGITQAVYDRFRTEQNLKPQDVATITLEVAKQIYRQKYWRWESRSDQMCDALETADFDTCVNFGVAGATMFLQEIFGLRMDGIFGPQTLAAVLANNNKRSALRLVEARIAYRHQRVQEDSTQRVFLQGWLNRDNDLRKLIERM